MFKVLAFLGLIVGQGSPPSPKPAAQAPVKAPVVDRSAEPQLRKIFEQTGKLRPLHVRLYPSSRWSGTGQFDGGGFSEIWVADKGFRIEVTSEWGQTRSVCDGKTFMLDPMDDGDSIRLTKAEKLLFKNKGSDWNISSPFLYLVEGSAGFDASVQKDAPVVERSWPNGERSIEFHVKDFGSVNVFCDPKSGELTRVEYCPLELMTKRYNDDPGDNPPPDPGMLLVDRIEWLPVPKKLDASLFDPTPPPGKQVEDQRKKG